jgi:hypothetical protein
MACSLAREGNISKGSTYTRSAGPRVLVSALLLVVKRASARLACLSVFALDPIQHGRSDPLCKVNVQSLDGLCVSPFVSVGGVHLHPFLVLVK